MKICARRKVRHISMRLNVICSSEGSESYIGGKYKDLKDGLLDRKSRCYCNIPIESSCPKNMPSSCMTYGEQTRTLDQWSMVRTVRVEDKYEVISCIWWMHGRVHTPKRRRWGTLSTPRSTSQTSKRLASGPIDHSGKRETVVKYDVSMKSHRYMTMRHRIQQSMNHRVGRHIVGKRPAELNRGQPPTWRPILVAQDSVPPR